jgi:sRNA-binding carbon storage regulator CsrA
MAMIRDLKPGDSIFIGDSQVTVESKSGQRVRLRIEAPKDTPIQNKKEPPQLPMLKQPTLA